MTIRNELFFELGSNKRCFWTNEDVLRSETYRIFLFNDLLNVKRSMKMSFLNSWPLWYICQPYRKCLYKMMSLNLKNKKNMLTWQLSWCTSTGVSKEHIIDCHKALEWKSIVFSLDNRVGCSDKESKTPPTVTAMCDWQLFPLSHEDTKIDTRFWGVMRQSQKAIVQSMFACLHIANTTLWGNRMLCIIVSV